MKKSLIVICGILILLIIFSYFGIEINRTKYQTIKKTNKEFEQYLNKDIYGTDVATIINKVINVNNSNNIPKDEADNYIEDNEESMKVDIVFITDEENEKTTSYSMEKIAKVGIDQFIDNFNTQKFVISSIKYHTITGKIKYIEISQKN